MKVDRYIAGLLLLCFSVFLGHNLVPHYHLSEISCAPFADSCPSGQGDQGEHQHQSDSNTNAGNHHAHCHAFNDVILEKFSLPEYNSAPVQWHHMDIPGLEPDSDVALLQSPGPFTSYSQSCCSFTDIGTEALRAPPVSV